MEHSAALRTLHSLGAKSPSATDALVLAEATRRKIEVSCDSNGQLILKYSGRSRTWARQGMNLNSALPRVCVRNKDVASRLLQSRGFRTPENLVFERGESLRAWEWASSFAKIALQPAGESKGPGHPVIVETQDDFQRSFEQLSSHDGRVLVEEVLKGTEHHVLVVNRSFVAALRKNSQGDSAGGVRSTDQDSEEVNSFLPATELMDSTAEFTETERSYIQDAAKTFPGLRFAHFHVLRVSSDPRLFILGIDPAPSLSAHHFPGQGESRDVAAAILDLMFPSTAGAS